MSVQKLDIREQYIIVQPDTKKLQWCYIYAMWGTHTVCTSKGTLVRHSAKQMAFMYYKGIYQTSTKGVGLRQIFFILSFTFGVIMKLTI